jgi:hypothetical protein
LPIALVVGIAGGATLLAVAAVLLALWCAARMRARRNRNSDTGSSDPSTLGELRMASSLWTSICFVFPFTVLTANPMRQWSGEKGGAARWHRTWSIRLRGNSRWRTWCRPPRTSATRTSSARGASDWCTWACFSMALLSRSRGAWGQRRRCLLMR